MTATVPNPADSPVTRIDPALPIVWENTYTLRIGFDRAEARFAHPTAATQRIIAALRNGVPTTQVAETLRSLGANQMDWARVIDQLGPALISTPPPDPHIPAAARSTTAHPATPVRIGVLGPPLVTQALIHSFLHAGFRATQFVALSPAYDLVVVAERFIEPLDRSERLAATGLPQMLIRFTDRSLRVGPIVSESGRPCAHCLTQNDLDAETGMLAIAAQVYGQRPAAECPAGTEVAANLAVTLIRHWVSGSSMPNRVRLHASVRAGLPSPVTSAEEVRSHDQCGCAHLASHDPDSPGQAARFIERVTELNSAA